MKIFEHGGNIYNVKGQAEKWLDMSANINPLGLSETVKTAIADNIGGLVHYPDPQAQELKSAIAMRYDIATKNIITLNGAAESFYLFFNTFKPSRVLIPVPAFSEYERAAKAAGCNVHYFTTQAEDNFNIDFNALIDTIKTSNINCIVLANPNNPTGNLLPINDNFIMKLLDNVEFVMIDESFVDFVGDDYSIRQLIKSHHNLIIVQSLTKFFAIPGLRLGFAIAAEAVIKRLEFGKDVWNVNYLAQKAGVAMLADEEYINETRRWLAVEREYVTDQLKNINGIKYFKPTVNFVLIKFKSVENALKVIDKLKSYRILVRSCSNFRGLDGSYIRMAIRRREENRKVLDILSSMAIEGFDTH